MKNILVILFLFMSGSELFAQTQESPWTFENGKTYEVTSEMQYKKVYARFTAAADGILLLSYYGCNPLPVYTDMECTVEVNPQPERMGWSPIVTEMPVKAGVTYYFYDSFVMNAGSISVEFDSGETVLELEKIAPANDEPIVVSRALFSFTFNRNILCDSIVIRSGSNEKGVSYNVYGAYISLDLKSELMEWFKQGVIKQGSVLQIELQNVRNTREDLLYGENGKVLIEYAVAAKPMELVATENTPESIESPMKLFPSYLMKGTCMTMAFDAPIACDEEHTPIAKIMYGDPTSESGYYYEENLEIDLAQASEGILKVEYGGKLRRVLDMIPHFAGTEDEKFTTIAVKVGNICSLDGEYAYSSVSGTLGSYTYNYDYVEINNNIVAEITPKSGAAFDNMSRMEIWIRGDGLMYDGVRFDYVSDGAPRSFIVEKDQLSIEADEEDSEAVIITLKVPEIEPDALTQVVVSMENLMSTDGLDYSSRLTATYNVEKGTGIQTQTSEQDERVHVYLLTGEEIMRNAPRKALQQLKAGMYIVNGKKWMKKD